MKKVWIITLSIICTFLLLCATACSWEWFGDKESNDHSDDNSNDQSVEGETADTPVSTYKSGEQIELYLNASINKRLSDYIDPNATQISIADPNIVEIRDDELIPQRQGMTYISCQYGNVIKNYNIIVYRGAEFVTSYSISGSTTDVFRGNVGQTYQVSTTNSSSCDISELAISAYTSYDAVDAEELISVSPNGEIRVVGIGTCEVWVHSATNIADNGVRFKISSSFNENKLSSAVEKWVAENLELKQTGVITKSELAKIEALTFTEVFDFNEEEWSNILPGLKTVTFDLREGSDYNSTFHIGSGALSYNFIGKESFQYKFSIHSAEREVLNLLFTDFSLSPQNTCGIDVSSVRDTRIGFIGICNISGADSKDNGNGCNGITANNLTFTLRQDAAVTISAGDGTSQNTNGTRIGGIGVRAYGQLNIEALSSSYDTSISIYGGNGGNGYNAGNSGGAGNIGISADTVIIDGCFSCNIFGGNGGNGKNGSENQTGGNGGNGASAIVCMEFRICESVISVIQGGFGGNGGQGGKGTSGKQGDTGKSATQNGGWGNDASNGGTGKTGGVGASGGQGGNGASALIFLDIFYNQSINTTMLGGSGGAGGKGGTGGTGGKGGTGGADDWWGPGGNKPGNGGTGGIGGTGGTGGDGGNRGLAYEGTKVIKGNPINAIDGNSGSGGAGGDGGAGGSGGNGGDGGANGGDGSTGAPGKNGGMGMPGNCGT